MNFNDYQDIAKTTAVYPKHEALPYLSLGLAGEAGEVANKVKKVLRGDYEELPHGDLQRVLKEIGQELGDVLWYIAVLSDHLGVRMDTLAASNLDKLAKRKEEGKLQGEGDNR